MERAGFETAEPEKVFTNVFPTGIRRICYLFEKFLCYDFRNEGKIYEIQNDTNENLRRDNFSRRRVRLQFVVFRRQLDSL